MPVNSEQKPKELELRWAFKGLTYVGKQCAAWHLREREISPTTENALVESVLIFIRKTVEFFKPRPKKENYADNLYACDYSYPERNGWDSKIDYPTLHKRVGHITIQGIRRGQQDWPLDEWVPLCLKKWIDFFEAVSALPTDRILVRVDICEKNAELLRDVLRQVQIRITNANATKS